MEEQITTEPVLGDLFIDEAKLDKDVTIKYHEYKLAQCKSDVKYHQKKLREWKVKK